MTSYIASALVAATVTLTMSPGRAEQTVWNLTKDFSLAHNPNGAWSYSGNHNVLHHTISASLTPGLESYTNGQGAPNTTTIARNITTQPILVGNALLRPGGLLMDPQNGITNVYWEAPSAGVYSVLWEFCGISGLDPGDSVGARDSVRYAYVELLGNRTRQARLLARDRVLNGSVPFPIHCFGEHGGLLTLPRGATLNFAVQAGSGYRNLATDLFVQIVKQP